MQPRLLASAYQTAVLIRGKKKSLASVCQEKVESGLLASLAFGSEKTNENKEI